MMDKQKRESPPFTSPVSKSNGFKIPKKKDDDWREEIHASSPLTRLSNLDLKNVTVRKRPYTSSYNSFNVPRNIQSHSYSSSPCSYKFMRTEQNVGLHKEVEKESKTKSSEKTSVEPKASLQVYLKTTEESPEASLSTVCRDVSNTPISPQKDLKRNSTEEGGANASKSPNLECKNSIRSNVVGSPDSREKTYCYKRAEYRERKTITTPTGTSVHCPRDKPPRPSSESIADCSLKSSDRIQDATSRTSRESRKFSLDSSFLDSPMSSSSSYSNRLSRRKKHLQNARKDCPLEPIVLSSDEEEREHEESVILGSELTSTETSIEMKEDDVCNKQCPSPSTDVEPMDCSVSILDQPPTVENTVLGLKLLNVYYGKNKGRATSSAKVTPKSIEIPLKVSLQQCKCISLDTMKLQRYGLWLTHGDDSIRSSAIIIFWITTDYIPHVQKQIGETSRSQTSKANELIFLELVEPLTGKEQSLLCKIMREASESGLPTLADMLTSDELYSMLEALSYKDCSFKANCGSAFKKQEESSNTSPPVAPPEASKVISSYTLIQKCRDGRYSVSMVPRQEGNLKEVDKGARLLRLLVYPPPPTKGGLAVTNEDLECLEHGEFLNDVIIDFYLKFLQLENFPKRFAEKCHIFSSFFFRCLTRKDNVASDNNSKMAAAQRRHHRVKTWTRHVDIFTKDFIFVPVNENSHWYLLVICFPWLEKAVYEDRKEPSAIQDIEKKEGSKSGSVIVFNDHLSKKEETKGEESNSESEGSTSSGTSRNPKHSKHKDKQRGIICKRPCLLIFDSLKTGSAQNAVQVLREYLKVEWDAKRKTPREFSRSSMRDFHPRVPKQNNSTDCGLYVLQYVETFAQKPIESFDPPMHLENWFPASVVKNKRDEIRDLILRLNVQQSKKS